MNITGLSVSLHHLIICCRENTFSVNIVMLNKNFVVIFHCFYLKPILCKMFLTLDTLHVNPILSLCTNHTFPDVKLTFEEHKISYITKLYIPRSCQTHL